MSIRQLESSDELSLAQRTFDQLFGSNDWKSPMYWQSDEPRALLHPSGGFLTHEQYEGVRVAAGAMGESHMYVSSVEGCDQSWTFEQCGRHLLIDLEACPWRPMVKSVEPIESAYYSLLGDGDCSPPNRGSRSRAVPNRFFVRLILISIWTTTCRGLSAT